MKYKLQKVLLSMVGITLSSASVFSLNSGQWDADLISDYFLFLVYDFTKAPLNAHSTCLQCTITILPPAFNWTIINHFETLHLDISMVNANRTTHLSLLFIYWRKDSAFLRFLPSRICAGSGNFNSWWMRCRCAGAGSLGRRLVGTIVQHWPRSETMCLPWSPRPRPRPGWDT